MLKYSPKINLSIIVPAFNEEEGIKDTVLTIFNDAKLPSIEKLLDRLEVIVVDDGSNDKTFKYAKNLTKRFKNLKIVKHKRNQGLGSSIKTGILNSKYRYITYLPADGQAFLREIGTGLKLAPSADLILTYRGKRIDYNHYRNILSNALMISMKLLFALNYKDYNWVHIYKKDLFKKIRVRSNGVFFLAEIVIRARNAQFSIIEAEARYNPRNSGYSKNARISVVVRTLIDLLKLWKELKLRTEKNYYLC